MLAVPVFFLMRVAWDRTFFNKQGRHDLEEHIHTEGPTIAS